MTATKLYGLYGTNSHDFLTYRGRVLVHDHPGELRFLVPGDAEPREIPPSIPADQQLQLRHHPEMCSVAWDDDGRLVPGQFRDNRS
jgi:hypothetical protein